MRTLILLLLIAAVSSPAVASATDVEGDVWGTWTKENSPYNVIGEVRVPPGSTLVIEPGVLVDFQGHYKFIVDSLATLLAVGTETDSIFFTAEDTATGWHGIRFFYADSNSHINYCRLEYGRATGSERDMSGGAIYCYHSSPTIGNNTISRNSAVDEGGAICCEWYSSPRITNNAISGNSAGDGGGIYCRRYSSPFVHHNFMSGNSANWYGGGIGGYYYCSPTITRNIITGSSAGYEGGGIFFYHFSGPIISANTISGNSADSLGGGITCYYYSFLTITNSILFGNTAWDDPEIRLGYECNAIVTYCDVQGGWPGEGNIDVDPLFVGPEREDFHLRWHSPCIDAGVPDSLDPDGTRSDIGAFYFNQDVAGIIEVYPHNTPIIVPPWGKCIFYDLRAFNFSNHTLTVDVRSYFCSPEIGRSRWLDKYNNISIPVGDSVGRIQIRHRFPDYAPPGDYTFVAYIGDFPNNIVDSSYFYLTKVDSTGGGTTDCLEGEDLFKEIGATESSLPNDYALSRNYPNPFNATTNINYQLPVNSRVKLEVYNVLGEKVATLVEEKQEAGYRSVIWEASELSSGLYFYKLTAGDYTKTRRMMLVK